MDSDNQGLVIDEYGGVFYNDRLVAPPCAGVHTVEGCNRVAKNLDLHDTMGNVHSTQGAKWYMGYEGTMVRVWLHPETDEVMLSTNRTADARGNKYGRSKTFMDLARTVLPSRDTLWPRSGSSRVVHHIVLVENALQLSSRYYVTNGFGLWLYATRINDDDTFHIMQHGQSEPPQPRGFIPTMRDFVGQYNRLVSRRQLKLDEVNTILSVGCSHTSAQSPPLENGEFVFVETAHHAHVRINSQAYTWRRQIVGNDHINYRRYTDLVRHIDESRDLGGVNLGVPRVKSNWTADLAKFGYTNSFYHKSWVNMTINEIARAVLLIYILACPRYLQKEVSGFYLRWSEE